MTRYFVLADKALVYTNDQLPHFMGVLAGDVFKGGPDPKNGPVAFAGEDLRPATMADFERFRVSPDGHLPPVLELTDELPDGLTYRDGRLTFECRVCGADTEWPEDPLAFDPSGPHLVCGGSPRCCP